MKLTSFVNYENGIEGYYISNASTAFKKRFPKKHILVSITRNDVYNEDTIDALPLNPFTERYTSYFFTYDTKLFNTSTKRERKTRTNEAIELLKVFPVDLSRYMINGVTKEIDTIIKLAPMDASKDVRLITTIVFRCDSERLMKSDVKETLRMVVEHVYKQFPPARNTEEWLLNLIDDIPFNLDEEAYKFGTIVEDKMFSKPFKPTIKDFFIGYSSRLKTIEQEIDLARYLETEFSSFKAELTIVNDYTDIVSRIEAECKKKNISYKRDGIKIILSAEDFYSLNLKFELINFIW